ncbi:MAG: hypothetical protein ACPGOY_07480 [Rhodospirillaceae bacterium]
MADPSEAFKEISARCQGTNINPDTLLATDYLNHFNEVIMLIEMLPDMPDMLEEVQEWAPKSYKDHFRDSVFSDKDLAVEAYDHVPPQFKASFEETINQMDSLSMQTVIRLENIIDAGSDPEILGQVARTASKTLQKLIDVASAIVHGANKTMGQDAIDQMMGG